MVYFTRALLPLLLVAACKGGEPVDSDTDAGTGTGTGEPTSTGTGGDTSTGTGETTGGSTGEGTGTDTGSVSECTFELTPDGGIISACGVLLSVPPGAVAAPTPVVVTQPKLNAGLADGLLQSSPVFRLAADDPNLELAAFVTLHVPHVAEAETTWMARHFDEFGAWGVLETCWRDEEWTGIRTNLLGTFTALEDLDDNDASGAGSISASWQDRMESFAFENLGHAHYMPSASGARSVDLYGVTTAGVDPETLKLNFVLAEDGTVDGALISMMVLDQGMYYSWIDWEGISPPSDMVLEIEETAPNHLVGSLAGTLYRDDAGTWLEMQVEATFEADIVRHFVPTDDPCPIEG